jgi:predicted amino acid dehydrogenase
LNFEPNSQHSQIRRVWIESATNTKMAQWKNVKVKSGMAQLEMQLSDEPVQVCLANNKLGGVYSKILAPQVRI